MKIVPNLLQFLLDKVITGGVLKITSAYLYLLLSSNKHRLHVFTYFLNLWLCLWHIGRISTNESSHSCSNASYCFNGTCGIGLPRWCSGKEFACQCRRCRFDPDVGKMASRRKWQPTSVFLPGKHHGQRSLVGNYPWTHKETRLSGWAGTHMWH